MYTHKSNHEYTIITDWIQINPKLGPPLMASFRTIPDLISIFEIFPNFRIAHLRLHDQYSSDYVLDQYSEWQFLKGHRTCKVCYNILSSDEQTYNLSGRNISSYTRFMSWKHLQATDWLTSIPPWYVIRSLTYAFLTKILEPYTPHSHTTSSALCIVGGASTRTGDSPQNNPHANSCHYLGIRSNPRQNNGRRITIFNPGSTRRKHSSRRWRCQSQKAEAFPLKSSQ